MAKRVEGVTERILECAKEEFRLNGYENASLRVIADKAGSSKGAIYIRYTDKESLYRALTQPYIDGLCKLLENVLSEFGAMTQEEQVTQAKPYADDSFGKLIQYIYDNFNQFKLITNSGEKMVYQELIHRLVGLDNEYTFNFIKTIGSDAFEAGRLTVDLAHLLSSAFYKGMFEVVIHDMPFEDATEHIQRMRRFYNAGWNSILKGEQNSERLY